MKSKNYPYDHKGLNINNIAGSMEKEEQLKKVAERKKDAITKSEIDGYGRKIYELGKKAYFDEYFYGIKLENQIIPQIGEINNPKETNSFKKGYEAGERAVKFNITEAIPKEYLEANNSVKKR